MTKITSADDVKPIAALSQQAMEKWVLTGIEHGKELSITATDLTRNLLLAFRGTRIKTTQTDVEVQGGSRQAKTYGAFHVNFGFLDLDQTEIGDWSEWSNLVF